VVTKEDVGKLVRIKSEGGAMHWMRGRLIDVESRGRVAIVLPFTHKHTERIPVCRVKVWKAKQS
jgi:hypothetical protein